MNFPTANSQMLGSEGRATHMNTSAIAGAHPMSNIVYGFRPECGWAGVLFQVFLQGPFIVNWQKQKEMDFWISFQGHHVPAVLYEMESTVALPEIGKKRYILQCITPEKYEDKRCSITLSVHGLGGKTIVGGLFIGVYQYIPNGTSFLFLQLTGDGTLMTYTYHNLNGLLKWLEDNPPRGIDYLSPTNPNEQCHKFGESNVEVGSKTEDIETPYQYPDISQGTNLRQSSLMSGDGFFQHQQDMQGQLWAHNTTALIDTPQQEIQYNEFYSQYYHSSDSLPIHSLGLHFTNPSGQNSNQLQHHQITNLNDQSDPQQYTIPQRQALSTPKRRIQSSTPYRPNQGYGKITFIHKPDLLGDLNTWTLQERQENRRIICFTKAPKRSAAGPRSVSPRAATEI